MEASEFKSLMLLLDDDDESVTAAVAKRLRQEGAAIIPNLERVWQTSDNTTIVRTLEHLIHDIRIDSITNDLLIWKNTGASDLLTGMSIYNRILFPNVTFDTLKSKIDSLCKPIWTELNSELTALEKVRIINHFFFDINRFIITDDFTTQSHFVSTLLNTGHAQANVVVALYAIIAQRLDLPIHCVKLPNALTLCYCDELGGGFENDVLFYIDMRSRGTAFGSSEIADYLRSSNIDHDNSYFNPCSNLDAIIYLIHLLAECLNRLKDKRAQDCLNIINSLTIK
jgi:hypothetical protein